MTVPRIIRRRETVVSPWLTVVEKEVCFVEGQPPDVYYSVTQADYVAVFAMTTDGRIPIVRQYRPAVETFTWEFPAGTVDNREEPAAAATRELLEETGLRADALHVIGSYHPDTGRLSLSSTGFFASCRGRAHERSPEAGIEVRYVSLETLLDMVKSGEFNHQLHVALIASAIVHGHIARSR
jgi:ADP-ribose pyrophosphatase